MSATEKHVKTECKRLAAAVMIEPKSAEGKREVVDALLRNCQSDEHVTSVMTAFLEGSRECQNLIAELVSIARRTQTTDQAPAGCDTCLLGPDLETGEMRWAPHVAVVTGSNTAATRCSCDRGRWFAAKDVERRSLAPPAKRQQSGSFTRPADFAKLAAGDSDER